MSTALLPPGVSPPGSDPLPHTDRSPRTDRPSADQWMMAFTAEVSCGVHLITRHRAPRVAAALAVTAGILFAFSDVLRMVGTASLCGALAAVGGARLLAPGPALAMARRAPVPRWLPVLGRWVAALAVLLPLSFALASGGAVHGDGQPVGPVWTAVLVSVGFHAALGMALAPLIGSFGSGFAGCIVAGVRALPVAAGSAAWSWIALPGLTVVLLGLAGWVSTRTRR